MKNSKRIAFFIMISTLCLATSLTADMQAKDGGDVIWSFYAPSDPWDWHHIRSVKTIEDIDGDGKEDVITVAENDTVYCLSGIDGEVIWGVDYDVCFLERGLISVPDLNGDSVQDILLAGYNTKTVYAISGNDGSLIWDYDSYVDHPSGGRIHEVSVMTDITGDDVPEILSGSGIEASCAYLFDGSTGTKIWTYPLGVRAAVYGIREVGDLNDDAIPDVIVTTGDTDPGTHMVIALDGNSGAQLWSVDLASTGWTGVPIGDINSDGTPDVAVSTADGKIIGYSGVNGMPLWINTLGSINSQITDLSLLPDIDDNGFPELLPSGTGLNSFYCIDASNGEILWSTPAVDQVFTSVAVSDITGDGIWDIAGGTGYTTCVFYAVDGETGDILWQKNMADNVESAYWIEDIDGNGYPDLLGGLHDGWLYALADGCEGVPGTEVSGEQYGTWTAENSPYFVVGDITVPAGEMLEIEPGVVVEVQGEFQITAQGHIIAEGTESDSIYFYGQNSEPWFGIRLEDENNQSIFRYCRISHTDDINAYAIHALNSPVLISDCFIDQHRKAIHFSAMDEDNPASMEIVTSKITNCTQYGIQITENSNALVDSCEITGCGTGTSYWPGIQLSIQTSDGECSPTITNNWIHHNGKQGITMANLFNYGSMAPHVENNVIEYNLTGIYLYNAQGYYKDNVVRYNFISGDPNSGAGVMLYGSGTNATFVGNEVTGNFCGFYIMEDATSNLGDIGNSDPNDDGTNHIYENVDESGNTYSVYNMSAQDIKAENNIWDSENYDIIAETIIDGNDNPEYGIVDFDPIYGVGIAEDEPEDGRFSLSQNYPNPMQNSTRISFSLPRDANAAQLSIYNIKGELVQKIRIPSGETYILWDGTDINGNLLPSGIYFYKLQAGGTAITRKLLLLR